MAANAKETVTSDDAGTSTRIATSALADSTTCHGVTDPIYVIEHLEEGLEKWCKLEYRHICKAVAADRVLFLRFLEENLKELVPAGSATPKASPCTMQELVETKSSILPDWDRMCLLDMQAEEALEPMDVNKFDAFVFGGILGNVIENEDGSYGSDDRTAELRRLGFGKHRRHLGPMQMTTDTAVLVCRMVLEEGRFLAEIPFVDSPDLCSDAAERTEAEEGPQDSVCMEGFRYVAHRDSSGEWQPTLPDGMRELLLSSADDDILGSL